jgi:hypothetical protein
MIIKINHIPLSDIADSLFFPEEAKETVKEWAKEQVQEAIMGALEAIKEVLVDLSFSLALVGGVLCVLFWVVGWKDGKRWAAILFLANVLIKLLLGGAA